MTTMQNKTVLITGATAGIGLAAARELARKGARLVIVSRSAEKCAATVAQIKRATGNQNVEFIAADLSTRAGVQQAAFEFKKNYARLDVLINNAGGLFFTREITVDGYEKTFALNHLNYFLLTNLLLDILKASASARIVNVASNAHFGAQIDFEDLMGAKNYWGMRAYGQSKLANILFTYELARKLKGSQVTANVLHPGFVGSDFAANNGLLFRLGMTFLKPFILSTDKGAETPIYLAASPEVEGVTGKYFHNCTVEKSDPASYDPNTAGRLWEVSLELVG